MEHVHENDPTYMSVRAREASTRAPDEFALPAASPSTHLWKAALPRDLSAGSYWIEVRSIDMFGQSDTGRRIIRVLPAE